MRQMKIDVSDLSKLGFSHLEVSCYNSLSNDGAATVSKLASTIGRRPSSLYRALKHLEECGFVASHRTDPGVTYYYSVPVEDALDDYFARQREQVRPIIKEQRQRKHLL
jgi:sugar-specific transcriptional regulator TrmB